MVRWPTPDEWAAGTRYHTTALMLPVAIMVRTERRAGAGDDQPLSPVELAAIAP